MRKVNSFVLKATNLFGKMMGELENFIRVGVCEIFT